MSASLWSEGIWSKWSVWSVLCNTGYVPNFLLPKLSPVIVPRTHYSCKSWGPLNIPQQDTITRTMQFTEVTFSVWWLHTHTHTHTNTHTSSFMTMLVTVIIKYALRLQLPGSNLLLSSINIQDYLQQEANHQSTVRTKIVLHRPKLCPRSLRH